MSVGRHNRKTRGKNRSDRNAAVARNTRNGKWVKHDGVYSDDELVQLPERTSPRIIHDVTDDQGRV